MLCQEPAEYSPVLTAVLMPPGHDADKFRKVVLDNYNMSLGSGLSKLAGKVFRIGHLGECNELTLMGALSGVEMGLAAAGVPHRAGGVDAAMKSLEEPTDFERAGASEGGQELTGTGGGRVGVRGGGWALFSQRRIILICTGGVRPAGDKPAE